MMDGVSWSASVAQESFSRGRTPAETLSKLASFISRAENKPLRHQRPLQQPQQPQQPQQQPPLQPSYACQECGSSFSYATDLLHHQDAKHSLPKPHRCPLCGQEFSLRSSLLLHKCQHSATLCSFCHGHLHPSSQCHSQCSASTPSSADPATEPSESPSQQPPLLDATPYACAPCGRGFSHKQALLQHQQAACSEPPSHVVDAGCLPSVSLLPSEGESDSSDAPVSPGGGARCVCQTCSRTFVSRSRLRRHRETSHRETSVRETREPRETSTWDKQLPDALAGKTRVDGTAENTKRRKIGKREQKMALKCRSCDLVCRSVAQLCLHRKEKHSRESSCQREVRVVATRSRRKGTYPCQVCGKVLFHHLSLKAHYRKHTADASRGQCSVSSSSHAGFKRRVKKVRRGLGRSKTFGACPGRPRRRLGEEEDDEKEEAEEEEETCDEVPETEGEEGEEEEEFPCPSCAQVFPLRQQLQEHEELHQSCVKRSRCSVCSCEMDCGRWAGGRRPRRLYHCVPCQQAFAQLHCFLEHCQEHLRLRVEEDTRASKAPDQTPAV